MTKNPYKVEENTLASEILSQMNKKRLLMCVFIKKQKRKIVGVIHIHHLISNLK